MSERDLDQLIEDDCVIEDALARAALAARQRYFQLGRSMPTWWRGQVVWIAPGELDLREIEPRVPVTRSNS